ncbi:hypothetical protein GJ744_000537 [Endocarpon pusillum]|uniref:Uncharacterized protein n=1 Tax=Endocarpon pusillum TaxID=364733 RepID=A0A8H7ABC5_9EURO|nr:hypothetical protein GJ744_000537 [Endocarpon pusillum]
MTCYAAIEAPGTGTCRRLIPKAAKRIRNTLLAFDEYVMNSTPSAHFTVPRPSVKDLGRYLQEYVNLIKDEVCNRNRDAFENNTWGRRAPRGEDEDDSNLFQYLIGHPSVGRPPFAVDALRILPKAVLTTTNIREQLEEICGLLHYQQAPLAYRRALQGILEQRLQVKSLASTRTEKTRSQHRSRYTEAFETAKNARRIWHDDCPAKLE